MAKGETPGGKEDLPLMATPPADADEFVALMQKGQKATGVEKGWRLEQTANGYFRFRWQMKDESGNPITYKTKSGKKGYKRGSKYVSIEKAKEK